MPGERRPAGSIYRDPETSDGTAVPAHDEGRSVATTNDLKNGLVLNLDGQLWSVVEFQHVKPGKGGAFVRTKLKNVLSGKVVDKTFNAGTKVDTATVDKRDMQYLYNDGADFVFMDTDDLRPDPRPARRSSATPRTSCSRTRRRSSPSTRATPLYVELPDVASSWRSPTPSRACRATARPAAPSPRPSRPGTRSRCRCSSSTGTKVKVDTRTGDYLGRVS